MVSLALPTLSTKNIPKKPKCEFSVEDSGRMKFPNDVEPSTYLDVIDSVKGTKYRFALNWTNQKRIASLGVTDTETLHGSSIEISVVKTKYKNKDTEGLRVTAIQIENEWQQIADLEE